MDLLVLPIESRGAIVPYWSIANGINPNIGQKYIYSTADMYKPAQRDDLSFLEDDFSPTDFSTSHELYSTGKNAISFFQASQEIISKWVPSIMSRIQKAVNEEIKNPAQTLVLSNTPGIAYLGHFLLELGFRHFLVVEPYRLLDWFKIWKHDKSQFIPRFINPEWMVKGFFSRHGKALAEAHFGRSLSFRFDDLQKATVGQLHTYSPQLCRDTELAYGYPYPEAVSTAIPSELMGFIQEQKKLNKRIFLFTLGSMDMSLAEKQSLVASFVEGTKALGNSAIILGVPGNSDESVFHFEGFVSYEELFPKVDLIMSHGGAGTVHLALFCGIPILALPVLSDQFSWVAALKDIGMLLGDMSVKSFDSKSFQNLVNSRFNDALVASARLAGEKERKLYANGRQRIVEEVEKYLLNLR